MASTDTCCNVSQNVEAEPSAGWDHAYQGAPGDGDDGGRDQQVHRPHDAHARGHSRGQHLAAYGQAGTDRHEGGGAVGRQEGEAGHHTEVLVLTAVTRGLFQT